jgi:polyhydroxybutyrate depolymerase
MNKILLLLLMAVLGIASAQAGDMRRLSVNGIERTYYLHVPTGLRSGAPLVIMLHGRDDDGKTDVDRYGWERVANGNRFVVAGPDAPTLHAGRAPSRENYTMWNSEPGTPGDIAKSDDTAFIAAMIDDIARTDGIDLRRVYVAGFSSGGHMANRLGHEISGRLAAIAISGAQRVLYSQPPSRGIPILFSAGDQDENTPMEGQRLLVDDWRKLDGCPATQSISAPRNVVMEVSGPCHDGSEVRYILMQGVDHKWPTEKPINLTRTTWEFFKRFSLPTAPGRN